LNSPPQNNLTDHNINTLCVIIEEISHFHLLLNRFQKHLPVSQLELEWQAEMDKLIVTSEFLFIQYQSPYLLPLIRLIYDHSIIYYKEEKSRYWEATKLAANYWTLAFRKTNSPRQCQIELRKFYYLPWYEKLLLLNF